MKKRKNIYVSESIWEKAKWIAQYDDIDLNDCIYSIIEKWVKSRMDKLKCEDPETFNAIEATASEKENAAKRLEDIMKKTKVKESIMEKKTLKKRDENDQE